MAKDKNGPNTGNWNEYPVQNAGSGGKYRYKYTVSFWFLVTSRREVSFRNFSQLLGASFPKIGKRERKCISDLRKLYSFFICGSPFFVGVVSAEIGRPKPKSITLQIHNFTTNLSDTRDSIQRGKTVLVV